MNERIAKLYDQSIIIDDGGDYVCGELDPVKFAELIIKECALQCVHNEDMDLIEKHFGVEK